MKTRLFTGLGLVLLTAVQVVQAQDWRVGAGT